MTVQPSLAEMLKPREKGLLRFLTCGSVDDGKSTLIGRLLYDSKLIFEDQLATLEKDSRRHGTTGEDIDFALLVDGLEAEREQGITIDVAYRFFSTAETLLHRRRHAGARAIHPQHGDRRLHRRPRRADDRCAQGRPRPDQAACHHLLPARHREHRRGRSTRSISSAGTAPSSTGSSPTSRLLHPASASPPSCRYRFRRDSVTTSPRAPETWRGITGRASWSTSRRSMSRATWRASRSASPCSG